MTIFLEKSAEHLEKALKFEHEGNLKEARYNLLRASDFLYKAAEKSEPWSKQKRIEWAESILKRAEALGRRPAVAGPLTAPQAEGERAMAWLIVERPEVKLSDVAGLDDAKEHIKVRMVYPFAHPALARRFGLKKGGGLLLYGPPGTGKTMLARAVAGEIDAAFFVVRPSDIMSKWVGEAEQNIAQLFSSAKKFDRSIIFIDEVEALIPKRSGSSSTVMQRVVPQILSELEGFGRSREDSYTLLFIGATNEPWALDEAVLRPGRFDERIYIPLPDFSARLSIVHLHLKDKPLSPDISFEEMARLLDGHSGADIRRICEKASEIAFIQSVRTGKERNVERHDLLAAIEQTQPSVSPQVAEKFGRFAKQAS